jgi:transcriptional regulator CtsR
MPGIADFIEEYIKSLLGQSQDGEVVIRRNELAEHFRCAPSQINYVLTTRFSFDKGYIIESRRGGGGFVRIVRVTLKDKRELLDIILDTVRDAIGFNKAVALIERLFEEGIITAREAAIMVAVLEKTASPRNREDDHFRAYLLRAMLTTLLQNNR